MKAPTATKPNIYQLVHDAEAGPDNDGEHDSYVREIAGGWVVFCTHPTTARDVALAVIEDVSLYEWAVTVEPYAKSMRHPWRTVEYTHRVVVVPA